MSRRVRQAIKDLDRDITNLGHRMTQVRKTGKSKPVVHEGKNEKQLKPFVTQPATDVKPRVRQKSRHKIETREIHKEILENKNSTIVITVKTKHKHVSRKRNERNLSPKSKIDLRDIPKEVGKSSHSSAIPKEAAAAAAGKERKMKGLPWSCLLNNQNFEYATSSSVCSDYSQCNNVEQERKGAAIHKNNCFAVSQTHNRDFIARTDRSVQCTEPQREPGISCVKEGSIDPIGALKLLFTDVLSTLQKNQNINLERNLNTVKSCAQSFYEDEPVCLPCQNTDWKRCTGFTPVCPEKNADSKRLAGFTPVCPEKASPADVISAPVPVLPTLAKSCQSEEGKTGTTNSSPSVQKQLEVTNLLLEETYKEIAMKCKEYRKERDQLREEVIQQQKKVDMLMEKEKNHLMVINSLQAGIDSQIKVMQKKPESDASERPEDSKRNADLEMELQLLKLQGEKYQLLTANKEKEVARFKQELQEIQSVISQHLETYKLVHHKVPSSEVSSLKKGEKPVCSSPTSSIVSLGTLESWQKISCILSSNDSVNEAETGVMLGENVTLPSVKCSSPVGNEAFHNTILQAKAAFSESEPLHKLKKELSQVFEKIRQSRIPLPSPPHTYAELSESQWTDLSEDTQQNTTSINDTVLSQATENKL